MMKILYLEDNKIDIELTKVELQKSIPECRITIANTISEADKIIKEKTIFDVALLDINLPDGNGIDVLLTIRRLNLPTAVIILTSSGDEDSAIAALKAGADDYLNKNLGYLKKLPDTINNAIKNFTQNIEKSSKPLNVLYVEWNTSDIDFTQRHIQKYAPHIHIDTVPTAIEALKILPKTNQINCPYQILMLDYRLPGLNALDTVKKIRQERNLPISIVIVTGHGSEEIAVQALKLGANEYLVKSKNYLFRLPSILTNAYQRNALEQQQIALKESEAKYRLLAENSGDVIFILDLELNYTYISPAVKTLRGYTVEEALKQNLTEVLTPDSFKQAQKILSKYLPQKGKEINSKIKPQVIELEMIKKDGSTIWTEVKASVLFDNSIPIGIQGVTRDISKRKKAMDELRKLSRAMEQSPATVVITDINGNIEYVNPYFTKVTGYTFDEVKGKNPKILKSGNLPEKIYTDLWQKITNGEIWIGEFENKKKDKTIYWESASISPIIDQNKKITHFLAVKEDITEKKNYEKELIIARDQARESDRLKSAFLATMSHELRTPLNAIIGFSGLVDNNLDKEKIIEFSQVINKSGNHLLNIIEDIFTVSMLQTEKTKINSIEFNLSDFINSLIHYTNVEANNKNKEFLTFKFQPVTNFQQTLKTDKTKIYQVLINFIKNAIEFTDEGEITVGYTFQKNTITFFVKDTGVGIPDDKVELIFERFRQIDDSHTRKHGGVGLGLAICSEIANLLKGKIWIESKEGIGSTFFFSVPNVVIQNDVKVETHSKKVLYPDLQNKTILIVEDEETNYLLLKIILKNTMAKITWAKNGEESIDICKSEPQFDLILMDIRMPGIDGFEAAKQIKEIHPSVKIVAQTAYALSSDRDKIMKSKCDDYVLKPIVTKELLTKLKKYLKS